jgi:uncharacterized membrane protein
MTLGKLLVLIGAIILIVTSIYSLGYAIYGAIQKLFDGKLTNLIPIIVWVILGLLAGYFGYMYSIKNKYKTVVQLMAWIILIVFVATLVMSIINNVGNGNLLAGIGGNILGGVGGVLYLVGYFLDNRR